MSVTIFADVGHKSAAGELTAIYKIASSWAGMLIALVGRVVIKAAPEGPGTLFVVLSSGESVEIYDTNEDYQSYWITHGDKTIVV